MGFASIFAQATATNRDGQIVNTLIIALLVVAFLLAASTVWYWRHTDPNHRDLRPVPAPVPRQQTPPDIVLPPEPEVLAETYAADDGMSVDEWLSLTGPQKPPTQ